MILPLLYFWILVASLCQKTTTFLLSFTNPKIGCFPKCVRSFGLCPIDANTEITYIHSISALLILQARRDDSFHHSADIGIIGGGASGMFAAASAVSRYHELQAQQSRDLIPKRVSIVILEQSGNLMSKVQLSGGGRLFLDGDHLQPLIYSYYIFITILISLIGRCNVLHDTNKPLSTLLLGYPRGRTELQGLMMAQFGPLQAQTWFEQRGVQLKTEPDGRMFPITDSSQTIVDTIYNAVITERSSQKDENILVRIEQNQRVVSVEKVMDDTHHDKNDTELKEDEINSSSYYQVITTTPEHINITWNFHSILLATGSSRAGYQIANNLGHDIITPVPSLFTLSTKSLVEPGGVFHQLSGISVPKVQLTWKLKVGDTYETKSSIVQEGPLLITHVGVSGPAPLRLSAFGARNFYHANYKCNLTINWIPDLGSKEKVESLLWKFVSMYPKRKVSSYFPFQEEGGGGGGGGGDESDDIHRQIASTPSTTSPLLAKRLWSALVHHPSGHVMDDLTWGDMSKVKIRSLAKTLCEFNLPVSGKGVYKDEFVTAGGICLKRIHMKCMESKIHSGLYFSGEMLNIDGVTGGFNFMNCWSTGFVAGKSAMDRVLGAASQQG